MFTWCDAQQPWKLWLGSGQGSLYDAPFDSKGGSGSMAAICADGNEITGENLRFTGNSNLIAAPCRVEEKLHNRLCLPFMRSAREGEVRRGRPVPSPNDWNKIVFINLHACV